MTVFVGFWMRGRVIDPLDAEFVCVRVFGNWWHSIRNVVINGIVEWVC